MHSVSCAIAHLKGAASAEKRSSRKGSEVKKILNQNQAKLLRIKFKTTGRQLDFDVTIVGDSIVPSTSYYDLVVFVVWILKSWLALLPHCNCDRLKTP